MFGRTGVVEIETEQEYRTVVESSLATGSCEIMERMELDCDRKPSRVI
jgi:hypothetical protein